MRRFFHQTIIFVFCLAVFWPAGVWGASFSFSPRSASYQLGDTFPVSVILSSPDRAVNAVQGKISFPADKLQVIGLSKSNRAVGLWIQEPNFSNTQGTVNFEGVILNPGFRGPAGTILTLQFRVKNTGRAPLRFSSGAILANDGQGTNVLENLGQADFALGAVGGLTTTPSVEEQVELPLPPQITSSTHSESDRWYNNNSPEFSWDLPEDIIAVRTLYDRHPSSAPTVLYQTPIKEKAIGEVKDGVWYFHLQVKNSGGWSPVSHFRFQIDTVKPSTFELTGEPRSDLSAPRPTFSLQAVDDGSGVAFYELKIDDDQEIKIPVIDGATTTYQTGPLAPGRHTLLAKAVDGAGNYLLESAELEILPLAPPVITEYPAQVAADEPLMIKGKTYPDSRVTVWLESDRQTPISQSVMSDGRGDFTFNYDSRSLKNGVYRISAEVARADGATSGRSETVTVAVLRSWLGRISSLTVNFLTFFIPMFAMLVLLALIVWSSWRHIRRDRARVSREVREAEMTLTKAFELLHEDAREQLRILEKTKVARALTAEETSLMTRLKTDLDEAEKLVKKEIRDIAP